MEKKTKIAFAMQFRSGAQLLLRASLCISPVIQKPEISIYGRTRGSNLLTGWAIPYAKCFLARSCLNFEALQPRLIGENTALGATGELPAGPGNQPLKSPVGRSAGRIMLVIQDAEPWRDRQH